ncbi:E3 ubiquitin-protein ligase TRIM21-like [Alosa pseudoharengus]|uniref:E3 ubiquitin-protein ligase TRIM21-like n=1 Tax=Alosa pseudoharengus TaxID=34774 RepID=UPI003F8ADA0C
MELPSRFLSEEQFCCSICLDMFSNPVSTPCGHSFCLDCISSYWDGKNKQKVWQCPLCKESFRRRPDLHVNHTLKEITEQFKRMAEATDTASAMAATSVTAAGVSSAAANPTSAVLRQPKELPNELINEMKSRFQRPLPTHSGQPAPPPYEAHSPPPVGVTRRFTMGSLGGETSSDAPPCPVHRLGLELFCRNDQVCVCTACIDKEHYGHSVVPAKREWAIKKAHMDIVEVELKDMIELREKKAKEIRSTLADIQAKADHEVQGSASMFTSLVATIEARQAQLLEVVEQGRLSAELRAQVLLGDLEQETDELRRRSAAFTQLSESNDYVFFLKTFPSLSTQSPMTREWAQVSLTPDPMAGAVLRGITHMVERLQEELRKLPEICSHSQTETSLPSCQPRQQSVQDYAENVTLDPSTAHPRLVLSTDYKRVHCSDHYQPVPDSPLRFDRVVCVLAEQAFTSGRHYWEVHVGGKTDWDLGIASHAINRKGKINVSPAHGLWFLSLRNKHDYVFRTDPSTALNLPSKPQRIGIFVDMDNGLVSFYDAGSKHLIYTYTDTFTAVIHPFFSPCTNKSGKNESPLVICPISQE